MVRLIPLRVSTPLQEQDLQVNQCHCPMLRLEYPASQASRNPNRSFSFSVLVMTANHPLYSRRQVRRLRRRLAIAHQLRPFHQHLHPPGTRLPRPRTPLLPIPSTQVRAAGARCLDYGLLVRYLGRAGCV